MYRKNIASNVGSAVKITKLLAFLNPFPHFCEAMLTYIIMDNLIRQQVHKQKLSIPQTTKTAEVRPDLDTLYWQPELQELRD